MNFAQSDRRALTHSACEYLALPGQCTFSSVHFLWK